MGQACSNLRSLNISSCRYLAPNALEPLLRAPTDTLWREEDGMLVAPAGPMLAQLAELDVSYCPLSTQAICQLLGCGRRLTVGTQCGPHGCRQKM